MFGLSFTHLILFGIIALIFIGPEQLPEVARTIGRLLNELRRATQDFQNQFTGQFHDQQNTFNDIRNQLTNLHKEGPVVHPNEPPYKHHDPATEHSAAAAASAPAPELPVGNHPVSEDEEKKS